VALLVSSLLFFPTEMLAIDAMPVLRLRPLALVLLLVVLAMLPPILRALLRWGRFALLPWLVWPLATWLLLQAGWTLLRSFTVKSPASRRQESHLFII